jgi:hypothetical protein
MGPGGQLDPQAVGTLVVAPDEQHVALLRVPVTVEAGCMNRGAQLTTGTLIAVELRADGSFSERVVAERVQAQSISFSSDARGLVFLNDVDTCGVGKLRIAAANGANVRLVHDSVNYQQGVGRTVFFTVEGEEYLQAAPIAGGRTVSLGTTPGYPDPVYAANATGTAFAFANYGTSSMGVASGSLIVIALLSGRRQILVDGTAEELGNCEWSPRGGWLAFSHGQCDADPGCRGRRQAATSPRILPITRSPFRPMTPGSPTLDSASRVGRPSPPIR